MTLKRVLITGATGRTGYLVVERLRQQPRVFEVVGFARSATKINERFGSTDGMYLGDITQPSAIADAVTGCDALVILTSAVPQMKEPPQAGQPPQFEFIPGGMPEQVDYLGQKNQIDTAVQAGVTHIVLVSSMGGTDEHHPLNHLGNGKIAIWKRKAEQYLIDSGITYTIIRAGGLLDQPGGQCELMVGNDDAFLRATPRKVPASISRADVAEIVVQALLEPNACNKAFDVIASPYDTSSGIVTQDFSALFAQTTPGL